MQPTEQKRSTPAPIRLESPEQLAALPGYQAQMQCSREQLDYIVGKYEWNESSALPCGLNGCDRKHWNGWAIARKDGRKTHCGRNCGEREFDVKFKEVEAVFKQAEADAARMANISDALMQRDDLLARGAALEQNAAALVERVREITSLLGKEPALTMALNDALRNGGQIRRAVKADRELLAAMGQRTDRVELETIGIVAGGEAVQLQGSIAAQIRAQVLWPLRQLTPDLLEGLSGKALATKSTEISNARQALQQGDAFVEIATQFISPANRRELAKLAEVIPSRSMTARVTKIAHRLTAD